MPLPAYWWLLALPVVIQGAFFVRFAIVRLGGKALQPLSGRTALALYASVAAGMAYGVVQRDPLFVVGQGCLLMVFYRMRNPGERAGKTGEPGTEDKE
ncbi:lipid A biosynthesis domain-containing protein [Pseudodesulfovibrio sp. F-1]|uniref:Lipid A biosynthesis domain-containing protein n=1 Tax=Pseudodesulfovibrio alkaliphilus TaxID=2661613 RepID=A0A7K1KLJ8_9BACT|nr:lipid A biosynthesis domain-containing protein [Pseudodesulfovibrio alkaliphilus]MUM76887.1 lipid A biosynthesis domain-containing protein [Pseudodesulfovibrio alkaliphilus]